MKTLIFYVGIIFSQAICAQGKSLSAHVHGIVGLDIASEKNEILIMLKSPSDSFLGFEYKAKTNKERTKLKAVKKQWETEIFGLFGKKELANCKITSAKWQQKFQGKGHSEIHAEAYLKCKENISGKELSVSLIEKYPKIEKIHLQLIRENGSVVDQKFNDKIFKIKL